MNKNTIRASLILFLVALPLLFVFQNCGKMSTVDQSSVDPIPEGPDSVIGTPLEFEKVYTSSGTHSCGITATREAKCWGSNSEGMLGFDSNSLQRTSTPVLVAGLSGVMQLSLGQSHTCALIVDPSNTSNKIIKCFGSNGFKELGIGNDAILSSATPVQVLGIENPVAISSGNSHTCALKANGTVMCWGRNSEGQLGNGTVTPSSTPVTVSNLSNVVSVETGQFKTCAVRADGNVWCWGGGILGDGTHTGGSSTPVQVVGETPGTFLTNVRQISLGNYHTCALLLDKSVNCWGYNNHGQLGTSTLVDHSLIPMRVLNDAGSQLREVTRISLGQHHSCALLTDGKVKCWGGNNFGQLGSDSTVSSSIPIFVAGLSNVEDISGGHNSHCAILHDNTVKCWGENNNAAVLGNGALTNSSTPVHIPFLSGFTQVSRSYNHTCALKADKTVSCWGPSETGAIGDGTRNSTAIPKQVQDLDDVQQIATSVFTSCALLSSGRVKCWGGEQGGAAVSSLTPTLVNDLTNVSQISMGEFPHSCAVLLDKTVRCWGENSFGQLGNGTSLNASTPVEVSGLRNVSKISLGLYHSCALLTDKTVWCWGQNFYGQLGVGSFAGASSIPVRVTGLTNAIQISLGSSHSCALLEEKTVKCWGYNKGALGDGTMTNAASPVLVTGLTGVVQLSAGRSSTCAKLSDHNVKCWGNNSFGQLGANGISSSITPIASLLSFQGDISCSGATCFAIKNGQVKQVGHINLFIAKPSTLVDLP